MFNCLFVTFISLVCGLIFFGAAIEFSASRLLLLSMVADAFVSSFFLLSMLICFNTDLEDVFTIFTINSFVAASVQAEAYKLSLPFNVSLFDVMETTSVPLLLAYNCCT